MTPNRIALVAAFRQASERDLSLGKISRQEYDLFSAAIAECEHFLNNFDRIVLALEKIAAGHQ